MIAVPLSIPEFIHIADSWLFLSAFQYEFSPQGAVADLLEGCEVEPTFVHQLKAHRPDSVIYYEPHPQPDKQPFLQLADSASRAFPFSVPEIPWRGIGHEILLASLWAQRGGVI